MNFMVLLMYLFFSLLPKFKRIQYCSSVTEPLAFLKSVSTWRVWLAIPVLCSRWTAMAKHHDQKQLGGNGVTCSPFLLITIYSLKKTRQGRNSRRSRDRNHRVMLLTGLLLLSTPSYLFYTPRPTSLHWALLTGRWVLPLQSSVKIISLQACP